MDNKFLVIYGPTGVGKTDISMLISQKIPAEIINMDVGQFYVPFTIGTAKPLGLEKNTVMHHMFDILNTPEDITVVEYRKQVTKIMKDIWQQGKLPIFVGGSGFYLRSLLFPPSIEIDKDAPRAKEIYKTKDNSWEYLYSIDSKRAQEIERHDTYRIERAIHIWLTTGKKPSEYKPEYQPAADYKIIFLTRDRQELYSRINRRVDIMMESGWLNEVRTIIKTEWEEFVLKKKLIGYNELIQYWHQGSPSKLYDKVIGKIKQRTRHYAKRQHTFWRMLQQQICDADFKKKNDLHQINLTNYKNEQYSYELIRIIKECCMK